MVLDREGKGEGALVVEGGGFLIVEAGGFLIVEGGGVLVIDGGGFLIVEAGDFLIVESWAFRSCLSLYLAAIYESFMLLKKLTFSTSLLLSLQNLGTLLKLFYEGKYPRSPRPFQPGIPR